MKHLFTLPLLLLIATSHAQELTGSELLQKTIEFHDPNGNWETFKGGFNVVMKTPNSSDRISKIQLNFPKEEFVLDVAKEQDSYRYHIKKE